MVRILNPYSPWDFEYNNIKLELKVRRYAPFDFLDQAVAKHKIDNLKQYNNSLYFVQFQPRGIYYLNLSELDTRKTPQKEIILKGGKTMVNYLIPFNLFTQIQDTEHLLETIQRYNA